MRASTLILALLSLSRSSIAGDVLVVDPNGTRFTDIASAVAAAQDGDVVLVKAGSYPGFTISNKGVAVVADVARSVQINGTVQIVGVDAQRDVLLSGLRVVGMSGPIDNGLYARSNAGSIRVQHCDLQGNLHASGAWIGNSSDVALTGTSIVGGDGAPALSLDPHANGGVGVVVSSAQIALYVSTVHGGDGAQTACFGGSGGDGLQALSTHVFAGNSLVSGGTGAHGQDHCYATCEQCVCGGGNAGNGVSLQPPAALPPSQLTSIMNVLQPGTYGTGGTGMGCCGIVEPICFGDNGSLGNALVIAAGNNYTPLAGTPPTLSASLNPVREQSSTTLTFMGQPGDLVYLIMNSETSFHRSDFKGVQLVPRAGGASVAVFGPIDSSGILAVPFPIADLGPGVESQVLHMQTLHKDVAGSVTLGNAVHLVMLDQAF